ncbi:MAG TPA: gliding motility-associated protein GldE [Chitinophagales bacterium]|nr:gliding motility-associated protein GldE [Chitinophagales bacterium]
MTKAGFNLDNPFLNDYFLCWSAFSAVVSIQMAQILAGTAMLLLICCSALISGAEVGFFSLTENEFNKLRKHSDLPSRTIIKLLSRPRHLLATILISNNLLNVSIVILSYFLLHGFTSHYPLLGFVVNVLGVTFFIVVFGEVLPKVYATRHNIQVALLMALPLQMAGKIFKPLSYVLVSSTRLIEKRLSKKGYYEFDPAELEQAIDITSGKSSKHEAKMLKGIVRFGNITVRQIMRTRMEVVAVDDSLTYTDLLKIVMEAGYSRIPVYRDNLDNIIGILYVKDLLEHLNEPADFKWQRLLRPPMFTPEAKKIDTLLKEIQKKGVHLVVAVDEYGGTSGIVTLEDILEEVIGEIRDEYDLLDEKPHFEKADSKNVG